MSILARDSWQQKTARPCSTQTTSVWPCSSKTRYLTVLDLSKTCFDRATTKKCSRPCSTQERFVLIMLEQKKTWSTLLGPNKIIRQNKCARPCLTQARYVSTVLDWKKGLSLLDPSKICFDCARTKKKCSMCST